MQFVKKEVILNYVMFGGLITNYVSYFTGNWFYSSSVILVTSDIILCIVD